MKKRLLAAVLMLCLSFGLVACGSNGATNDTQKENTESTQPNKETEKESENTNNGKIEYKVTVVDANGAPVANVAVQVCDEANCFLPVVTDANGVAVFTLAESNEYKAKIMDSAADYVKFEAGKTELTLTVTE